MKKKHACFVDGEEVQVEDGNSGVHIDVDDEFLYDDADVDLDVDSNLFEAGVWE